MTFGDVPQTVPHRLQLEAINDVQFFTDYFYRVWNKNAHKLFCILYDPAVQDFEFERIFFGYF